MSCVWTALISALKVPHLTPAAFLLDLKARNKQTPSVLLNGVPLGPMLLEENMKSIAELSPNSITNGYDMSTCDPLLFLVCDLYDVNIVHTYNGVRLAYLHIDELENHRSTHFFASNLNHFWHVKSTL